LNCDFGEPFVFNERGKLGIQYEIYILSRSVAPQRNALQDALRPAPQSGANRHSFAEQRNEEKIHGLHYRSDKSKPLTTGIF